MKNMFIFVAFLYINFSLFQAEPIPNTRRNQYEASVPVNQEHSILPVADHKEYTGQRYDIRPPQNQNSVIGIGNGNHRVNVVEIDDRVKGYTGTTHRQPNVNSHHNSYNSGHYSQRVSDTITNTKYGLFYPPEQDTRRIMVNNIGNGGNNRNMVIIDDGLNPGGNSFTILQSSDNNEYTQQIEFGQQNPNNHRNYNSHSSGPIFANIGRGHNNKNVVIINDQVIQSDKGIIITSSPSRGQKPYSNTNTKNAGPETKPIYPHVTHD